MLFPTISFAIFFALTIFLYWGCVSVASLARPNISTSSAQNIANKLRKFILLLASYVFYGIWDWRFLPLLLGSTLCNYIFARLLLWQLQAHEPQELERKQRRAQLAKLLLILALAVNLALLIFFKYINWLLVNLNILLNAFGLPLLFSEVTIILPLGISFFTFQNISFLLDIYRRQLRQSGSYLDYSLYIAFFPQLIAGPIVRANNVLPQLQRLPSRQNIYLSDAVTRIFIGLVKKIFIANTLSSSFVDPIFLVPSGHSSLELLLAAYAYSAVIYCDFSAYSDIAIGLGLLCGVRLMENFDRPYARSSLQEFWRSWHISLSTWLRDYLYIPLGGNRNGKRYRNIILSMLLGGLWHGSAWTFLLWGALHGIAISCEHFLRAKLPPIRGLSGRWRRLLGWGFSFHFVTFTWILFRSPSFAVAGAYFAKLFSFDFSNWGRTSNVVLLAIALGILPQIIFPRATAALIKLVDALPFLAQILLFAVSVALLQVVLPQGVAPFIYYQF